MWLHQCCILRFSQGPACQHHDLPDGRVNHLAGRDTSRLMPFKDFAADRSMQWSLWPFRARGRLQIRWIHDAGSVRRYQGCRLRKVWIQEVRRRMYNHHELRVRLLILAFILLLFFEWAISQFNIGSFQSFCSESYDRDLTLEKLRNI